MHSEEEIKERLAHIQHCMDVRKEARRILLKRRLTMEEWLAFLDKEGHTVEDYMRAFHRDIEERGSLFPRWTGKMTQELAKASWEYLALFERDPGGIMGLDPDNYTYEEWLSLCEKAVIEKIDIADAAGVEYCDDLFEY